jgi:hypothetical protein
MKKIIHINTVKDTVHHAEVFSIFVSNQLKNATLKGVYSHANISKLVENVVSGEINKDIDVIELYVDTNGLGMAVYDSLLGELGKLYYNFDFDLHNGTIVVKNQKISENTKSENPLNKGKNGGSVSDKTTILSEGSETDSAKSGGANYNITINFNEKVNLDTSKYFEKILNNVEKLLTDKNKLV